LGNQLKTSDQESTSNDQADNPSSNNGNNIDNATSTPQNEEPDRAKAFKEPDIKRFAAPDSEWLHFVMRHRNGAYDSFEYDVAWGPESGNRVVGKI
jgi:hypothetical protein